MKPSINFLSLLIPVLTVSCSPDPQNQIVSKINYGIVDNQLDLSLEFNSDMELNTEFAIPVREYGFVDLFPSSKSTGFTLGFRLNLNVLHDEGNVDLELTNKLPDGQPMSTYIQGQVLRMRIQETDQIATSLYLGTSMQAFYLGTAVELSFLDGNFPAGLVISQRIRDSQKRPIGVISIYGPQIQGSQLVHPGGIFFMTNVTDLIQYMKDDQGSQTKSLSVFSENVETSLIPDDKGITINEPYNSKYKDKRRLKKLLELFQEKSKAFEAKDEGVIIIDEDF